MMKSLRSSRLPAAAIVALTSVIASPSADLIYADATALVLAPANQTAVLGQPIATITPTATGTTQNRLADLFNVRTVAGPAAAGVSPATVTTTELAGIQGITQSSNGDFYAQLNDVPLISVTASGLVQVARSTGAVTPLTGTLTNSPTIPTLQSDANDNLYIGAGNSVVQLSVSGTTFAETGRTVTVTGLKNFQVTDAGRVYAITSGGHVMTAVFPTSGTGATAAAAYPTTNPIVFSAQHSWNAMGLYVDEDVAGNANNTRVFGFSNNMAAVEMAIVTNDAAGTPGVVSGNGQNVPNYQFSASPIMDEGGNLYFQTQMAIRRLDTRGLTPGGAQRQSEIQAGQGFAASQVVAEMYRNTAAASGYLDGPLGTNRIYTGGPVVPASNPPSVDGSLLYTMGALVLDSKGANPSGDLVIADTGNMAIRTMNRVGWAVTPALHNGLTLNADGTITGTPTGTTGLTPANHTATYTVTYTNADGSTVSSTASITFETAPSAFNYGYATTFSGNPGFMWTDTQGLSWGTLGLGVFALNAQIPLICPRTVATSSFAISNPNTTCGGPGLLTNADLGLPAATTFSISPGLPAGVTFDPATGGISGAATAYAETQNYTITATNAQGSSTHTLQFGVPSPKTITFMSNGGTGTMPAQSSLQAGQINSNTFTPPAGKAFAGWNSLADGTGAPYGPGETYHFQADMTLHAQWSNAVTVTLDANGGLYTAVSQTNNPSNVSGTAPTFTPMGPIPSGIRTGSGPGVPALNLEDPSDQFSLAIEKPGSPLFGGWAVDPSGQTGEIFYPGDEFALTTSTTLHALWFPSGTTFTMSYDLQGGIYDPNGLFTTPVTPPVLTGLAPGARPQILYGPAELNRTGYTFIEFNSRADGTGANRDGGFKLYNDTIVYAIWAPDTAFGAGPWATLPLAGGTIALTGAGFSSSMSVTLGGVTVLAPNPQVSGAGTQLQLTLPAMPAGTHQLSITVGNVTTTTTVTYSANTGAPTQPGSGGGSSGGSSGSGGSGSGSSTGSGTGSSTGSGSSSSTGSGTGSSTGSGTGSSTGSGTGSSTGSGSSSSTGSSATSPVLIIGPDGTPIAPVVAPGTGTAVAGGSPVAVQVAPNENASALVMAGPGFELRLSGDCTSGCSTVTGLSGVPTIALEQGGVATVSGFGFSPGTEVHVWIFSDPIYLGSASVASDGTFTGTFPLVGVGAGEHTVQANGTNAAGEELTANLGIVVSSEPVEGRLPATGAGHNPMVGLSLVLLLFGFVAVSVRERLRSR